MGLPFRISFYLALLFFFFFTFYLLRHDAIAKPEKRVVTQSVVRFLERICCCEWVSRRAEEVARVWRSREYEEN